MTKWDPKTDSLVITCECSQEDHHVEFTLEDWAGPCVDPSRSLKMVVRPAMNPNLPFFTRFIVAFKYLFNIHSYYKRGHYDTVLISDAEDIQALERLTKRFIAIKTLREASGRSYVRGTD